MSDAAKEKLGRILVLCVDSDDDLGVKAGIKTPILGREENLKSALSLALKDPEEPDANAIFEAVRIYDRLRKGAKENEKVEVATVSGSELGGLGADRKVASELTDVLEAFPANDVVLVTDGFRDESILPLLQSRVPVTSVRRIVMKHSESIEETAALFSRYLKMLVENPRYSRIVLGLPGILMIILCLLWLSNLLLYAWAALLIVVGGFLFVKGFGVDRAVSSFYRWVREYSPPPLPRQISTFSIVTGALLIGVGCYQAGALVAPIVQPPPKDFNQWVTLLPRLAGKFISQSITLIVIGVCIILAGRIAYFFFERDPKLWRTIVITVTCAWSQQIFYHVSKILVEPAAAQILQWELVAAILIGILLTVATFFITSLLHRRYFQFFKENGERIEES